LDLLGVLVLKRSLATLILLGLVVCVLAQEAAEQPSKKIYLPKSPRAAAYILKLQSNEELVTIVRSEPVYIAILEREGLEQRWREEAVRGLAKLHDSEPIAELLASIQRVASRGDEASAPVLLDLASMLLSHSKDELSAQLEAITDLQGNEHALASQIGFAAGVKVSGDARLVADRNPQGLANLLSSVAFIEDADLRGTYFPVVEENWDSTRDDVRRSALTAASLIPGKESQTLQQLNVTIQRGKDIASAIEALQGIDLDAWPRDSRPQIAETLIEMVHRTSASQRTLSPAKDAIVLIRQIAGVLPKDAATEFQAKLDELVVQQYPIHAPFEKMAFAPDVIVVPAGRPIEVVFRNDDDKPHNFLLTEPGKFEDVGLAAQAMATTPEGQAKHYVPDSGVLQASTMIWPEQEVRINFESPRTPGVYPFVCTFPGHWLKMYGAMVVVEDVAAYLANHATLPTADELLGKKTVKQWTYEDLAADAARLGEEPRSFANGQRLFVKVSCVACHKIGQAGLLTGNIGPDLTEIATKHKTPEALLHEIIQPSLKIEDKYASLTVVANGVVLRGVVVERTDTELIIKENPLVNCEPKTIKTEDIEDEAKSDVSPMPEGLLNTLYKEEILDLLAFVFSGGDASHALFQ
jgi:putative heme-binding domain-containing protein